VLVIGLVRNPLFGLYAYVGVFYLDAPNRWWGHGLPNLRWSFIAAAATFVAVIVHRRPTSRKPWFAHAPVVLFCLFVLVMWLQWPWALTGYDHSYGVTLFTKYIVVIFLIYSIIDSRERVTFFLYAHVLGALYLGYLAYFNYSGGRLDGIGGPGIDDANSLSMQMCTAAYAGAALFLGDRSWRRWAAAVSVVFAVNVVIMAGSRGGFLAFVAGGIAFWVFRPQSSFKTAALWGAIGLGLFGVLASDLFWDRISSIGVAATDHEQADGSAQSRFVIIEKQWEMARDFPLGVGHKGTASLSYRYIPSQWHSGDAGRSSHNTLMSALVDQGFIGLLLWILMLGTLAAKLIRQRRIERLGELRGPKDWLLAGVAAGHGAIFVGGMFAPYIKAEVFVWYLALACIISIKQMQSPTLASNTFPFLPKDREVV